MWLCDIPALLQMLDIFFVSSLTTSLKQEIECYSFPFAIQKIQTGKVWCCAVITGKVQGHSIYVTSYKTQDGRTRSSGVSRLPCPLQQQHLVYMRCKHAEEGKYIWSIKMEGLCVLCLGVYLWVCRKQMFFFSVKCRDASKLWFPL